MSKDQVNATSFSDDVVDLLALLAKYHVKYLIIGGGAVIFYGKIRLTGDLDIYYEATQENVCRLYEALSEFWSSDIPEIHHASEFLQKGLVVQFGVPPNRIDLLNEIDAVDFLQAWPNRKIVQIIGKKNLFDVYFIGLDDLISNKEAVGRPKDLDDLVFLREARNRL